MAEIINKGTNAGGSNTTLYGKHFENQTDNEVNLIQNGYEKHYMNKKSYYLSKTEEDRTTVCVSQQSFKIYMKIKYNIEVFRCPDEAYIIEFNRSGEKFVKILEKKEQNVNGSVETKLWAATSLKREYELVLGNNFKIHYALCVNDFLKKKIVSAEKKYQILNLILSESNIPILFGEDETYFETLNNWISSL